MATTYTENYHLGKQENHADKFRMDVITANMDIIDEQIKKNEDEITSAKGTYTTLSERLDEDRAVLVEIVDSGAKNVLNYTEIGTNSSHGSTFTNNGVTFTLNSDGSITAARVESSTADSSCNLRISTGSLYVDDYCTGEYVLSGCPTGGGESTFSIRALRGDTYRVTDTGDGALLPSKESSTNIYINMLYNKDYDSAITFKPMICTKAAWDISQQYVPYKPGYDELIARIEALEGGV